MSERITILGAGPGGYIGAIKAAQKGAAVTVIERESVGGTCLNRGCIPTKAIKASADAQDIANRLSDYGLVLEGRIQPDLPMIMARKNKIIAIMVKAIEGLLKQYRINLVRGEGRVISPGEVMVTRSDGNQTRIKADKLVLATGSDVMNLPALSLDGQQIISSTDALNLEAIPRDLLIVGGGVMGAEFASIFHSLGSRVTVVEAMDRMIPLPFVDDNCSILLRREFRKRKITVHLDKTVVRTAKTKDGRVKAIIGVSPFSNRAGSETEKEIEVTADKILVTVGRTYNSSGIGLNALGMEISEKGWIPVDNKLQTNIKGIYAIGDLLGPRKSMLAHVASVEGQIAVKNCLGADATMDYRVIPSGIFTSPEIANVGLTEQQAVVEGLNVRADTFLFRTLGKAQAIGELAGEVKMISDPKTEKILGVHIVGPHATDLIAEATLAIKLGVTTREMADTIHLHPSLSESLLETAHSAMDECLHLPPVR